MAPILAFGMGSGMDMLIILLIVLLLFGNRLPTVMRSLGQGVTEFKKGVAGIEDDHKPADKPEERKDTPTSGAV